MRSIINRLSYRCYRTPYKERLKKGNHRLINEEQIITGYPIDGGWRVEGGLGSYGWFVYITTLLLREASLLLYCIAGHLNPVSAPSILLVLLEPQCVYLSYRCYSTPYKDKLEIENID